MDRFLALLFAGVLFAPAMLFGDGGTLLLRKPAGPWMVTVFGTPAPLRVGFADLSVMVQRDADQSSVLDATVNLHLKKSSTNEVVEVMAPATRAQATNKLLYAARLRLPSTGRWRLEAVVTDQGSTEAASGEIDVLPEQAPLASHWPYIVVVPVAVLLFAMNLWLRRNRRLRRWQAPP